MRATYHYTSQPLEQDLAPKWFRVRIGQHREITWSHNSGYELFFSVLDALGQPWRYSASVPAGHEGGALEHFAGPLAQITFEECCQLKSQPGPFGLWRRRPASGLMVDGEFALYDHARLMRHWQIFLDGNRSSWHQWLSGHEPPDPVQLGYGPMVKLS